MEKKVRTTCKEKINVKHLEMRQCKKICNTVHLKVVIKKFKKRTM